MMIDRSEYDDDDVAADRKGKVLMMILMIERSMYWRCCFWSKGQGAEDVVADRKVKMLNINLYIFSKIYKNYNFVLNYRFLLIF